MGVGGGSFDDVHIDCYCIKRLINYYAALTSAIVDFYIYLFYDGHVDMQI